MNRQSKRRGAGFTLVEILVVLAILGLLMGLVGPQVLKAFDDAKTNTALIQIRDLEQALEMYKLDVGRFPNNEQGLIALVSNPGDVSGWNGPYLKKGKVPKDPWDRDYLYKYPGDQGELDVYTLGQNGQLGGEGEDSDVGNWQ
ncbi:MAG: type II secretion system major pseudopilin GspG [Pseudomonadota bacterium]